MNFCENSQSTNILPQIWLKVQILFPPPCPGIFVEYIPLNVKRKIKFVDEQNSKLEMLTDITNLKISEVKPSVQTSSEHYNSAYDEVFEADDGDQCNVGNTENVEPHLPVKMYHLISISHLLKTSGPYKELPGHCVKNPLKQKSVRRVSLQLKKTNTIA